MSPLMKDTHGAWTTNKFTVPVPGDYFIALSSKVTTSSANINVYVNGTVSINLGVTTTSYATASIVMPDLKAGDVVTLRLDGTRTLSSGYVLSIFKLSGPAQIAASETVTESYWLSANFVVSTATPINFDSREFDSHNAVTTSPTAWRFTAPISGVYNVSGYVTLNSAYLKLYKNGSALKGLSYSTLSNPSGGFSTIVRLLAGEYVDLRTAISATATGGTMSADGVSNVSITRVGNY